MGYPVALEAKSGFPHHFSSREALSPLGFAAGHRPKGPLPHYSAAREGRSGLFQKPKRSINSFRARSCTL